MPKLPRLFGQRRHQRGVRMAKRVHRNACAQIQKSAAVLFNQPRTFAFDKAQGGTGIGRQNRWEHQDHPYGLAASKAQKAMSDGEGQ